MKEGQRHLLGGCTKTTWTGGAVVCQGAKGAIDSVMVFGMGEVIVVVL